MRRFFNKKYLMEKWWIIKHGPLVAGDVVEEWVKAERLMLFQEKGHLMRLEAGYFKKRLFLKDKFVKQTHWPFVVGSSCHRVSGEGKFE